jgi:hypothetical protein
VFLGYSPHHKGVKCLDTFTGWVYISKDVLFDESVFPFTALNPNARKHLQEDVLIFRTHTLSTPGDAHVDDYIHLPVVPNVTNVHAFDIAPTVVQVDAKNDTLENYAENACYRKG